MDEDKTNATVPVLEPNAPLTPIELKVADEIDILVGAKEAPPDPRFETSAPELTTPPVSPAAPASTPTGGESATPAPAPSPAPEPPPAPGDGVTAPPKAPEVPPVASGPPVPVAPPTPAPTESPEVSGLRVQNAALQAQISDLVDRLSALASAQAAPTTTPTPQTPAPASAPTAAPTPTPAPAAPAAKMKYVADEAEFDSIVSSADKFNEFIGRILEADRQKTKAETKAETVEHIFTNLPSIVTGMVNRQIVFGQLIRDFYDKNRDLMPHNKFVGFVMNELISKDPEADIGSTIKKTGEEVRRRLGIAPPAAAPTDTNPSPGSGSGAPMRTETPGFVGATGSRAVGVGAPLTGLEKEVNELI